jgi:DNA polymerase-3 subunit gamma/tau
VAYQSLYRRYRSQKFAEILGQPHVTTGLKSAIAEGRYGHAYLFSGPRGTGKTSTARVLAKALNCENLADGEPCGTCESCVAIENGKSFDLHELDAASHNKVDDIRDLISKVQLGSPGRTKVYILDEVHMLSSGAENALLKTLEEPPDHVVFVLATTEPQKVVPTIRSRTQHFQFHLLPADVLAEHVRSVIADAELDVDDDAIEYVLREGGGSARDTLSALDLVAAAGGVPEGTDAAETLTRAIGGRDPAAAIAAIQAGLELGREPRTIGEDTLDLLRDAFLASMGAPLGHLNDHAQGISEELGGLLGPATLTRSLEAIGQALVEMRQAPDPRVPLEVAVLRLTRGVTDPGDDLQAKIEALESRIEALETGRTPAPGVPSPAPPAGDATAVPTPATAEPETSSTPPEPSPSPSPSPTGDQEAGGRQPRAPRSPRSPRSPRAGGQPASTTGRADQVAEQSSPPAAETPGSESSPAAQAVAADTSTDHDAATSAAAPDATTDGGADEPGADTTNVGAAASSTSPADGAAAAIDLATVTDVLRARLDDLSQKVRARFKGGRILEVEGTIVRFGAPNPIHRDRCEDVKADVEQALSEHFGQAITIEIVIDTATEAPIDPAKLEPKPTPSPVDTSAEEAEIGPVADLADASDQSARGVDRITKAFPGSRVVDSGLD